MLGYGKRNCGAKTLSEITHADDLDKNLEYYEDLKSGQRNYFQLEKRYLPPERLRFMGAGDRLSGQGFPG